MEEKTLKKRIVDFARNRYYFHINDLKAHFTKNNVEYSGKSLRQFLYVLKKESIIYESGKGWYSTIEKEFELDTKPVEKLIHLLSKRFPLLGFSCWSTEQIKGYYQHLPSRFITFVYADKDFLRPLKDFLAETGYTVYLDPKKSEAEKYVEFDDHTVIMRPVISLRKPEKRHWARIERIIVDLFVEMRKMQLVDLKEYSKVISNVIRYGRINMAEMFDYAYNRKVRNTIYAIVEEISS
jgi:hypothetical protein